ncbi:unnamed protein product [Dracunculus medinensis]|uniref:UAP56-interacting factor n=1 Tax=Dracunculus medinensis TaxID=318479 RepID=A0A0N4U6F9_DRAME|nr:unnamed protein product [Dracunculus medinensis]
MMVDKINMSLDEIIKKEKENAGENFGNNFNARKRKNRRRVASNSGIVRRRNRKTIASNNQKAGVATLRMVNRLVKVIAFSFQNAIRNQTNQALISRAARIQRRSLAESRRSRLAGRLFGVNQRSKVIGRRGAGRAFTRRTNTIRRGRGIARLGQLVSDSSPVVHYTQSPELVETIAKRPMQRVNAQKNIRKRVFVPRRRRLVVVDEVPIQSFRTVQSKGFGNRFTRVNPNAERMKAALGIGTRRWVEADSFGSTNSFLDRLQPTVVQRRRF